MNIDTACAYMVILAVGGLVFSFYFWQKGCRVGIGRPKTDLIEGTIYNLVEGKKLSLLKLTMKGTKGSAKVYCLDENEYELPANGEIPYAFVFAWIPETQKKRIVPYSPLLLFSSGLNQVTITPYRQSLPVWDEEERYAIHKLDEELTQLIPIGPIVKPQASQQTEPVKKPSRIWIWLNKSIRFKWFMDRQAEA